MLLWSLAGRVTAVLVIGWVWQCYSGHWPGLSPLLLSLARCGSAALVIGQACRCWSGNWPGVASCSGHWPAVQYHVRVPSSTALQLHTHMVNLYEDAHFFVSVEYMSVMLLCSSVYKGCSQLLSEVYFHCATGTVTRPAGWSLAQGHRGSVERRQTGA